MINTISYQEINKKISDLTLAVYRITGLFPDGEASVHRIRERSMEILEDVTFYMTILDKEVSGKKGLLNAIEAKINALLSLFKIVRAQNFVKELNFDILEWEYKKILELVSGEPQQFRYEKSENEENINDQEIEDMVYRIETGVKPKESLGEMLVQLNERQRRLIGFFKNNGSARLKELTGMFPDVSEKTIRNDLKVLCGKNFLRLNGRAPQSYYSLR